MTILHTILHALGLGDDRPADAPTVDVPAMLDEIVAETNQPLDWRQSIVDLMKLLSLDSSQDNRWKLAMELGYPGDMNESAALNVWLHAAVMRKLAENGGRIPPELL